MLRVLFKQNEFLTIPQLVEHCLRKVKGWRIVHHIHSGIVVTKDYVLYIIKVYII